MELETVPSVFKAAKHDGEVKTSKKSAQVGEKVEWKNYVQGKNQVTRAVPGKNQVT